jgi:NAD(P)-dependent dehydrogenase (short-subunit alcohol dehydrogenase family)
VPEEKTAGGFEMQFGVNHVAHFLLFQLLKDTLLASSTAGLKSRVVALSSSGHRAGGIHFDNYSLAGEYDPWTAYDQSKIANNLFVNELDRRYGPQGLHGLSVHPGVIMDTELSRHQTGTSNETMDAMLNDERFAKVQKSTGQGAATQVWAVVAKSLEGRGGIFLDNVAVAVEASPDAPMFGSGYLSRVYDKDEAARLWKDSLRFVNMSDEA